MLTIEFHSTKGTPVADGLAEETVLEMYERGFTSFVTSTENLVMATRALVAEGTIPHTEVQFRFKDQVISIDRDGRCLNWPVGFCDAAESWLFRLLKPVQASAIKKVFTDETNAG